MCHICKPRLLPRRKTSFTKISASEVALPSHVCQWKCQDGNLEALIDRCNINRNMFVWYVGGGNCAGTAVEELTLEEPTVAEDTGPTVKVKFELQRECHFGQEFNVVGGDPQFGDWDPKAAKPMVWSEGHIWTLEVDVPEGRIIEFKYVLTGKDGEVDWQPGANYVLETIAGSPGLLISEPWTTVEEEAAIETAPVNPEPTIDKGILEVSSPGDASTDAAATATVGILNAGVKAVAAIVETLEGEEGSLVPPNGSNGGDVSSTGVATNGVDEDLSGQEETPTVPEIPVIDAALAVAAEEVRGDGKEAEDPAIID